MKDKLLNQLNLIKKYIKSKNEFSQEKTYLEEMIDEAIKIYTSN